MTQRDRIVLGVLAMLAVIGGFYMAVLKPNQAELSDLDKQITAAETRRDTAVADLSSAAVARKQYEQDQQTLAVLGKAVPADEGVPSLLYQLNSIARKAGVDFDTLDLAASSVAAETGAPASGDGLTRLPLNITFDGTFFKLDRFLREVHRLATITDERIDVRGRLLTIDSVALAPGTGGLPTLKAQIGATAYVAPADASGAAPGAATAATPAAATDATASTTTSSTSSGTASTDAAATATGDN